MILQIREINSFSLADFGDLADFFFNLFYLLNLPNLRETILINHVKSLNLWP